MIAYYLELGIVVGTLNKVHYPCKPTLLLNGLVRLHPLPLQRSARITCGLLGAFFNKNLQDLQDRLQVLHRGNRGLISQQAPGNLASHSSSCRIWLRMQKWYKIGESKCSKEGEVGLKRRKKEVKDVGLGSLRVEVGTVRILRDPLVGEGQDAVDVVQAIRIDTPSSSQQGPRRIMARNLTGQGL